LIMLLSKRPGEFARGLDRLLRFCIILDEKDCLQLQKYVIRSFEKVATKVSSSILLNLISYFKNRDKDKEVRVFFPKGNMAKAYSKENKLESLEYEICLKVIKVCENALISIYSKREPLNKVFVDERLKKYIVPTSQRNAAKTLKTVARGSRFLIKKETKIIRAFLYWKEPTFERCDLDLSAIFYDENFNRVSYIAYYELRDKKINCCHSGDIVSAPNGASEYVDIDLKKIKNKNVRYIALVVNSYSNQPFCDLPQCFAGYMEREEGELGKIFEPATVRNKADISTAQRVSMPIVIDAYNMEVIWTDLGLNNEPCYENNIETHKKSALMTLKSIVNITKPNIYDLAVLNAMARGELVKTKEGADTIFSLDEGVTPYDIELIMSEYL
ncbi:MAG: TerD family protein, partial [Clostridium sp.]